jgi:flagellar hook assembly protein FlgD
LRQNYPNPFNPATQICYKIPDLCDVELSIFDILGRQVITIQQERQIPGWKLVAWNGRDKNNQMVPGGVYFCRLKANKFSDVIRMLLIR